MNEYQFNYEYDNECQTAHFQPMSAHNKPNMKALLSYFTDAPYLCSVTRLFTATSPCFIKVVKVMNVIRNRFSAPRRLPQNING